MIKFFLLLLFTTILFAENYPSYNDVELKYIEKKFGSISKNRVLDYVKTINSLKLYSKQKQLAKVNLYLNQLLPQYDEVMQNTEDHWSTPKEFLTTGYGDCEDYVIIKYFTLLKLGFEEEKLFITTVHEKYSGTYHMVLSYFEDKDSSPLILDNLSFRIMNLKSREDLKADLFLNSSGIYKLNENGELTKVSPSSKKFQKLLNKIEKENFNQF